jgi:circadian clock protein KaiC
VEGLDRILDGGFPKHEIYLVQGEPGTGKTILGLQFLLAGRDVGEAGLFFTLTQRERDIEESAGSHGWTLEGIHVHQLSAAEAGTDEASRQVIFESSEVELAEVMEEVLEVVERTRPQRVVFDAIAELRFLAREPGRFQRQLFALRDVFADRGATVLFLDRQTPASGAEELEHISHGVILLEHKPTELGSERRRLRVLKMRGMGYHEGYHDFRIERGGLTVYPRLRPGEARPPGWKMLESGVDGLDELVGGGLAEGTSCLLVGPSGTGKTSVATLYACAAAERGERSALFLFEERPETFVRRSESLGMPVLQHIDEGMMLLRPVHTGELSAGEFAEAVRRQVIERDARVVVIDSLTGYMSAMPSEQILLTQMHDLLHYLSGQGVLTILVVAQHGILGPALGGPVDVSYLADTVLLLRHFESDGSIRQAISVFKKRYGEHEKRIRELSMAAGGIRVGEPLSGFQGLLTGTPSFSPDEGVLIRTGE